MASIFTFDPSPPSVSSPWSTPRTSTPRLVSGCHESATRCEVPRGASVDGHPNVPIGLTDNEAVIVTSLAAEPQDGPTEYKLHLLLRPRREFLFSSTKARVSGSARTPSESGRSWKHQSTNSQSPLPRAAISTPSRQMRLQQLTTQLLWRLQQSSSNHYTTYKQAALPSVQSFDQGQVLVTGNFPGLEDSKGALYEIGVADDGTFVGLAEDELVESLQTLSAMASSLGCTVSVLKKVAVGTCQWLENGHETTSDNISAKVHITKNSTLWVAEAYVRPIVGVGDAHGHEPHIGDINPQPISVIEQLRVTLTGVTLSGKSSLLGTLTTGTFDNGRGKSRLSLLKHQHEIVSGMTSSVTHELLGYAKPDDDISDVNVINFASGNVTSWVDIHASCEGGRLVFFSDSAGHPRYRRTTVRGLVGWAPHWTLLCIPADSLEDTSGRLGNTPPSYETLGVPNLEVDLSQDHLQLCLKLEVPMIIVMTKIDLASRTGLRAYLNKILSTLKRAGRQPFLIPDLIQSTTSSISSHQMDKMRTILKETQTDYLVHVPIVLTSAVKGTGVASLHALLQALPIPNVYQNKHGGLEHLRALFDIEDTYHGHQQDLEDTKTIVLSGALRFGQIEIGDELVIGPLQQKLTPLHKSNLSITSSSASTSEWCRVRVLSVRHLRLPTHALVSDQVGTIAIGPCTVGSDDVLWQSIRKGMVLVNGVPQSSRIFVAQFARSDVDPLSIGSMVVVYFNSVRASAKIIAGAIISPRNYRPDRPDDDHNDDDTNEDSQDDDAFGADTKVLVEDEQLLVTFRFLASREFVAVGSRVLVMPGGAVGMYGGSSRGEKGIAGLNGFVGHVVDPASADISDQFQS